MAETKSEMVLIHKDNFWCGNKHCDRYVNIEHRFACLLVERSDLGYLYRYFCNRRCLRKFIDYMNT